MRPPRYSFLLLALLGTAVAVPAFAQNPQSGARTVYPTCERRPTADESEVAHNAYLLGKRKYDEADYPSALVYFKDAYKIDCTKHELLLILSNTFEREGDKPEAVNALEVYLKRVPNAPDAEVQTKRIANLAAQISQQPKAGPAAPSPSPPTVVGPPAERAPQAAHPKPSAHSVVPWLVVGGGGVLLVTGIVVLAVGAGKVSEVKSACPAPPGGDIGVCPANSVFNQFSAQEQDKQGKALETVGVIVGGLGVAAIAGGLVWHFIEKPADREASSARLHFQPSLAPGYAGAAFGARF